MHDIKDIIHVDDDVIDDDKIAKSDDIEGVICDSTKSIKDDVKFCNGPVKLDDAEGVTSSAIEEELPDAADSIS